jgi:hypothetical protein
MGRAVNPRVALAKAMLVLNRDLAAIRKVGQKGQLDADSALTLSRYVRALDQLVKQHDEDAKKLKATYTSSSISEVAEEIAKLAAASPALADRLRKSLAKEEPCCAAPAPVLTPQ